MRSAAAVAALVLLALAGCGQAKLGEPVDGPGSATPSDAGAATSLTISVRADTGNQPTEMQLECDPTGGDHPNAEAACARLSEAGAEVFEPVPDDQPCTMIDGGPQTASITGTYDGQDVDAQFSRQNGCEIARWDALGTEVFDIPLQ